MTNISDNVAYTYIEYSAAFHMKYKHLFVNRIYDHKSVDEYPLIITWSETDMKVDEETGKCLAVAAKTLCYLDTLQIPEGLFEGMLQAFILFPDSNEDDEDTHKLRLEFVKALLNA